jgi:hypothetical protein
MGSYDPHGDMFSLSKIVTQPPHSDLLSIIVPRAFTSHLSILLLEPKTIRMIRGPPTVLISINRLRCLRTVNFMLHF